MVNGNQPRTVIQRLTRTPNDPAVLPDNTGATSLDNGVQVTTGTNLQGKENIGNFISHLAKADNHLWQALTTLQRQTNGLVDNTGNWTSWVPEFSNENSQPLFVDSSAAYYMTYGPILFIELYAFLSVSTNKIFVSLPINVGSIIIKTCAAYLFENSYDFVGVAGVQIFDNVAVVFAAPAALGTDCTLMMGGAIAIL